MQPMLGETVLSKYDDIVLTTHRVRLDVNESGQTRITSIMLEEVSSCSTVHTNNTGLLFFAAVSFIAAFAIPLGTNFSFLCITLMISCVIVFYNTRKHSLVINSAKESISVDLKSMGLDKTRKFIDDLETAKNERYMFRLEKYSGSRQPVLSSVA